MTNTNNKDSLREELKKLMITQNVRGIELGVGFMSDQTIDQILEMFNSQILKVLDELEGYTEDLAKDIKQATGAWRNQETELILHKLKEIKRRYK